MKKTIFFSLVSFFLIFFVACQKDSSGSTNYYMKANVGGTEKNYTANPLVIVLNTSGTYSLSMSAGSGSSSSEGFSLQINQNNSPITAGTYNENSGSGDYAIGAVYNPGTTDASAIFGAGLNNFTSQPLQIVISNISDSQVSGTFSGEFYDNSGTGTDSLLITNGEFNLPIQ